MKRLLTLEALHQLVHYDKDTGIFTLRQSSGFRKAGCVLGRPDSRGYIYVAFAGWCYLAHRLAVFYMTGKWPVDEVDHIDNCKGNNAWKNLREASHKQNQFNKPKQSNNTSGFKGVSWHKINRNWTARIKVNDIQTHLGSFDTAEKAHAAYCAAANTHFKEFARTVDIRDERG